MNTIFPKTIYSLWIQGMDQAPALSRVCWDRWASLNPGYELRVLDHADVKRLLLGFAVPIDDIPVQALSDIVRARLLVQSGGIWADATVFPIRALDAWLPPLLTESGFFAFERPGPDRALSSWFLAATPGNELMSKWWGEVERYWRKPRHLINFDGMLAPANPTWEVSELGGAAHDSYPYFWFHYLFEFLVESDLNFRARWAKCAKWSADAPHRIQNLFEFGTAPTYEAIVEHSRSAPIHKMNWRRSYPLEVLQTL
jgi:hypothetical protein